MLTLGRLASGAVILAIAILMSWLMMWGKGPVTNWTLKGDTRRIPIPFPVAYGADHGGVRDAVLAAARDFPFTLLETEGRTSQIWMVGFGDSSRNFELLVWPTREAVKRPAAVHAAYTWEIADALDAAGVEIPFPQTDLRIRSILGREGDDALSALGLSERFGSSGRVSRPEPPSGPTINDAAQGLLQPSTDPTEGVDP